MSTRKRRAYTPEYRREAAHLVIDTGRTIAAVAAEINVGAQLLGAVGPAGTGPDRRAT